MYLFIFNLYCTANIQWLMKREMSTPPMLLLEYGPPSPLPIVPYVQQHDRVNNYLNFDGFCLDVHLFLIVTCKNCQCTFQGQGLIFEAKTINPEAKAIKIWPQVRGLASRRTTSLLNTDAFTYLRTYTLVIEHAFFFFSYACHES